MDMLQGADAPWGWSSCNCHPNCGIFTLMVVNKNTGERQNRLFPRPIFDIASPHRETGQCREQVLWHTDPEIRVRCKAREVQGKIPVRAGEQAGDDVQLHPLDPGRQACMQEVQQQIAGIDEQCWSRFRRRSPDLS